MTAVGNSVFMFGGQVSTMACRALPASQLSHIGASCTAGQ